MKNWEWMMIAEVRREWELAVRGVSMPESRVARLLSRPRRTLTIFLARKFNWERPLIATTVWGDEFHGLLPEAVTSLIWRFGMYERMTTLFVLRHLPEGGTFVDIGAHFGYFTMLASRLVGPAGRVIAIEAMPKTYGYLSANIAVNSLTNVTAINRAASAVRETLTFKDFGVINSSLNSASDARGVLAGKHAPSTSVDVEASRADDLLAEAGVGTVDLIKIDAESSEEFVLAGMGRTLGANGDKPTVLIELGGGDAAEDARGLRILQTMKDLGYGVFLFDGMYLRPLELPSVIPYLNAVFVHRDRLQAFSLGEAITPKGHSLA
jgi:FkbM family methyltransferase